MKIKYTCSRQIKILHILQQHTVKPKQEDKLHAHKYGTYQ